MENPHLKPALVLRLPTELRLSIYQHLLPTTMIHIGNNNLVPYRERKYRSKKLYHSHCRQTKYDPSMWEFDKGLSDEASWGEHLQCRFAHPTRGCMAGGWDGSGSCGCKTVLSLMLACRLM